MVIYLLIKKVINFGLDTSDSILPEVGTQQEKHGELFKDSEEPMAIGIGMLA